MSTAPKLKLASKIAKQEEIGVIGAARLSADSAQEPERTRST
ncbi:hypothetical protein [Yersinia massiliensis]|nr:hypothetical protein [Yersinia massiliensis]